MRREWPVVRFVGPAALAVCLLTSAASAQGDSTKTARDEVDRQLREMMGKPPTKVKVTFNGLDEPGYKIEEATITLDGQLLPTPSVQHLSREGENVLFQGDYKPGDHRVQAKLVIVDASSQMISYQAGYKWKVGVERTFNLQPGLEVDVVITPVRDSGVSDPAKKFKVSSTAVPRMLAVLDDGSMPPPPPRANLNSDAPDAGVAVAAVDEKKKKAEEAAAAKAAAAEEKKRKADESAAAKAAAAEEKKRKAEEIAEEKKRKAEEAKAARLAAVEEKKRKADEKKAIAEGRLPTKVAGDPVIAPPPPQAEPADAGAPEIAAIVREPVDAGPIEVSPPLAVAEKPAPPAPASDGFPWVIVGAGGGVLVALIILLARRRANPRDPGV